MLGHVIFPLQTTNIYVITKARPLLTKKFPSDLRIE